MDYGFNMAMTLERVLDAKFNRLELLIEAGEYIEADKTLQNLAIYRKHFNEVQEDIFQLSSDVVDAKLGE